LSLKTLNKTDVAVIGRKKNTLVLQDDGQVIITTNIDTSTPTIIKLNPDTNEILISGGSISVISKSHQNLEQEFSVVYGERLTELLIWLINVMLTHSHPPNAPPIPDFYRKAQAYLQDLRNHFI
jgi:hypothetical protein